VRDVIPKHKYIRLGRSLVLSLKADILALDLYVPFGPDAKLIESSTFACELRAYPRENES
jgi:hypothetical protein